MRRLTAAALTGAMVLAVLPALSGSAPTARADEVTISKDALRTGWDPGEPALTPAAVSGGKIRPTVLHPRQRAGLRQPLVVGSTVIVANRNDWVYGLNATTGRGELVGLARHALGDRYRLQRPEPNIGVTGSPSMTRLPERCTWWRRPS